MKYMDWQRIAMCRFCSKQIQQFSPAVVAVVDDEAAKKMRTLLDGMANAPKLLCGKEDWKNWLQCRRRILF